MNTSLSLESSFSIKSLQSILPLLFNNEDIKFLAWINFSLSPLAHSKILEMITISYFLPLDLSLNKFKEQIKKSLF